jgi:hypothetical protein
MSSFCFQIAFCLEREPQRRTIEFTTLDDLQAQAKRFAAEVGFIGRYQTGIHIGISLHRSTRKPPGFNAAREAIEYFWPAEALAS